MISDPVEFVPEHAALFGPAAATTFESLRVDKAFLALDEADTVITDQGALPAHRLELPSRGLRVLVVGDGGPPADVA